MRVMRSVQRCVGDFCACALSTSCCTRARVLSRASLETRISRAPSPFKLPAKTPDCGPTSTGSDSPVTGAWFTIDRPANTAPSTGMRSPALTITISPISSESTGAMISSAPLRVIAVLGAIAASERMALRARLSVRSSSACPRLKRNRSSAPSAN